MIPLLLLGLVGLIGLVNLGQPLGPFGPFESNQEIYALQTAREMLLSGRWDVPIFNQELFWARPPGLVWLNLLAFKLLGPTMLAGRLPTLLLALGGVAMTYLLAQLLFTNRAISLLGTAMLGTSWGFFKALHTATPQPAFLVLFLLVVLLFFVWLSKIGRSRAARPEPQQGLNIVLIRALGGVFGLLFLFEGTLGILFPAAVLGIFLILTGQAGKFRQLAQRPFWESALGIALPWILWVALFQGHPEVLLRYGLHVPLERMDLGIEQAASSLFSLLLQWGALSLPWTFFLAGPFVSYFARRGLRKMIDFQEERLLFLLVWALLALPMLPVCPLLLLPPLCLLAAFYLVCSFQEARVPRSFLLVTDATLLAMMAAAVYLSIVLFQVLPDTYPGQGWPFPGHPQLAKLWLVKDIDLAVPFPVWKLWLIPFPAILLLTGLLMYVFSVFKRFPAVLAILVAGTMLFHLCVNAIALPIFSHPQGKTLGETLNRNLRQGDRLFIGEDPNALSPTAGRLLFQLKVRSGRPMLFLETPERIATALATPVEKTGKRYGILEESVYYRLKPALRKRLRVMATDWERALLPRKSEDKARDYWLLVEVLP